jgi:hypothetical protein
MTEKNAGFPKAVGYALVIVVGGVIGWLTVGDTSSSTRSDTEKVSDCYDNFISMANQFMHTNGSNAIPREYQQMLGDLSDITMTAGVVRRDGATITQEQHRDGLTVYVFNTPRLGRRGIVCGF